MRTRVISKHGLKRTNLNRRRAIRHHCRMCCDSKWSKVLQCRNEQCPLHRFRTGNLPGKGLRPEQRNRAIAAFCSGCMERDDQRQPPECDAPECPLFPYRQG
jgi:hypothetical protein